MHRNCFYRKKVCPRCQRLEQKVKSLTEISSSITAEAEEAEESLESENNPYLNTFLSGAQDGPHKQDSHHNDKEPKSVAFFISKDD